MFTLAQADPFTADPVALVVELLPVFAAALILLRYWLSFKIHRAGEISRSGRKFLLTWDYAAFLCVVIVLFLSATTEVSMRYIIFVIIHLPASAAHIGDVYPKYIVVDDSDR